MMCFLPVNIYNGGVTFLHASIIINQETFPRCIWSDYKVSSRYGYLASLKILYVSWVYLLTLFLFSFLVDS